MQNNSFIARLESIAYYVFVVMILLVPLVFVPTQYFIQDMVKMVIISLGTLIPLILYSIIYIKEKKVILPPKGIVWTSLLISVSLIVSSFMSINVMKSLFGQGYELNTAMSLIIMFIAALVASIVIFRRTDRVAQIYSAMAVAFIVLFIFHTFRFLLGASSISLGIFTSITSTLLGNWYDLSILSFVIFLISILAIITLTLSRKMKIVYWILVVLSALSLFIVNSYNTWLSASLVLAGIIFYTYQNRKMATFWKRIAWIPLIALVISVLFAWKGVNIIGPTINSLNAAYSELSLPWQQSLDVTSSAIKNYPLFGVGPNHFSQAYMVYKPAIINSSNAWNVEFPSGFGLIPTFAATQGFIGLILWIIFLTLFCSKGLKVVRELPEDSIKRFVLLSSFWSSAFMWTMLLISNPSHVMTLFTFVMTGIFFGAAGSYGLLRTTEFSVSMRPISKYLFNAVMILVLILGVFLVVISLKKTVSLAYLGAGVKQLNVAKNVDKADADFMKAISASNSDILWQARVQTVISGAQILANSLSSTTDASTSQVISTKVMDDINLGISYAEKAISYDNTNYYNYLSLARVYEFALNLKVPNAYDEAVKAYNSAISLNSFNPSIYLSLARLQVSQNKLDDAEKTLGSALQVKNNYLDGIFLLSQVEAAKGNLADAITAAKVASQISPSDSTVQFQLGLLNYTNKDYLSATQALEAAVKLQPDYANAQYFLGLAYARLSKNNEAIAIFQNLAKTNPDNQEVAFILTNLQSGKSPFSDAKPPVTSNPEKRSSLPIKENTKK